MYCNCLKVINVHIISITEIVGEVVVIDNIDKKILAELQRNGRKSYTDIAKTLGVVEGTVRKRVARLTEQEIIKIVAAPNLPKLSYNMISIVGIQVRMEDMRNVAENIARNRHVCYLAFVTGQYDLMAIVMTRSPQLGYSLSMNSSQVRLPLNA